MSELEKRKIEGIRLAFRELSDQAKDDLIEALMQDKKRGSSPPYKKL